MDVTQPVGIVPRATGTQQGSLPTPGAAHRAFDPSTLQINAQMLADAAIRHAGRVSAEVAATEVRAATAQAAAHAVVIQAEVAESAANKRAAEVTAQANSAVGAAVDGARRGITQM